MPRTFTEWFMVVLIMVAFLCGFYSLVNVNYDEVSSFIAILVALGIIILVVMIAIESWKNVPVGSVALPTILGRRYPEIIKEGWVFALSLFNIENIIAPISYSFKEEKDTFDNISCALEIGSGNSMPGGLVDVDAAWTYTPDNRDPERLMLFVSKGAAGIDRAIKAKIGEIIKHKGEKITWGEYVLAKESVSAELIALLTEKKSPSELIGGVPDTMGWGVLFFQIAVTEIVGSGKLQKTAQDAAAEELERKREEANIATKILLTNAFLAGAKAAGDTSMSFEKAHENVQVLQGLATKTIVSSGGDRNRLVEAVAAFQNPPSKKASEDDN